MENFAVWGWQVGAATATALVVFLWKLGTPALWIDEAATVNESERSGRALLAFLSERDAVLGPYYVFMHFWTGLGNGEWWVRLPSALAMTIAVGVAAMLALRWWGGTASLAAGLLLAVSPMASRYAQEARPYAIAIALALLAIWLLDHAVENPEKRLWWALYAVAVTLLGLFHIVALLTLIAHPLLLGRRRIRRRWLTWLGVGLVIPGLLILVAMGQREQVGWISPPTLDSVGEAYVEIAGGSIPLLLLGTLAILGAVRNGRLLPLATWFVVPPLLLALLGLVTPLFLPRYLVVCTPGLILLAAAGLRRRSPDSTPRAWQVVLIAVLAFGLTWPQHDEMRRPEGHGSDTRAAAVVIAEDCTDGLAVREGPATLQTFPYYLRRENCSVRWLAPDDPATSAGVERLWLVRPTWTSGTPDVAGFRRIRVAEVAGLDLTLWSRAD